jgi:hypothetical protein
MTRISSLHPMRSARWGGRQRSRAARIGRRISVHTEGGARALEEERRSRGGAESIGLSLPISATARGGASACTTGTTNVPSMLMLAHMAQEWWDRSARYRSSEASASASSLAWASPAAIEVTAIDVGKNCSACTWPNVKTKWRASAISASQAPGRICRRTHIISVHHRLRMSRWKAG